MAVRYYDESILNKIKGWVKDPKMTITSPDETRRLFEYNADVNEDKPIQLPLITLRRGKDIQIIDKNRKPLSFNGMKLNANKYQSDQLNGIPISLTYQIDIYTRYFSECDEYIRNFIFQIINFPKITIQIPYNNSNIMHNSNIRLDGSVIDNSDIAERLVPGQFTRFTIPIYVDDAYIFDYKFRPNYELGADIEVKFKNEKKEEEKIGEK